LIDSDIVHPGAGEKTARAPEVRDFENRDRRGGL
jgi:hypothetical protein